MLPLYKATNYYFEDDDKEHESFVICQFSGATRRSGRKCSWFILERNLQPSSKVPLKYKPAALPSTFSLSFH
ncbi:hypothetical protein Bca4012_100712 [Brassica carinata]